MAAPVYKILAPASDIIENTIHPMFYFGEKAAEARK